MPQRRQQRAFTLLELMVVLVIVGIMLGVVSFNIMPDRHQRLQTDAQRIALLLSLAREEAIVRNRPVAFDADSMAYRFLVKDKQVWSEITDLDMLRQREFEQAPVLLSIDPPPANDQGNLRIIFGREQVDKPFVLKLANDADHVVIRADGIGHFEVE